MLQIPKCHSYLHCNDLLLSCVKFKIKFESRRSCTKGNACKSPNAFSMSLGLIGLDHNVLLRRNTLQHASHMHISNPTQFKGTEKDASILHLNRLNAGFLPSTCSCRVLLPLLLLQQQLNLQHLRSHTGHYTPCCCLPISNPQTCVSPFLYFYYSFL